MSDLDNAATTKLGAVQSEDSKNIFERYEESKKWMRLNYYDELTEVYRAIKMRTKPIYKKDAAGKETTEEDKSQTNVCMPGPSIAWRRGVARLTASPYRLKYTGDADPATLEMLSALAMQQYDRSGEAKQDRKITMMGKAFGFSYGKLYWDSLARTMKFRKAVMKGEQVVYRDRASIMKSQGAPDDEIEGAVKQLGPEMDDDEVANAIGRGGKEITVPEMVSKYEGPIVKAVFIGDLFLMPHATSLDDSDYSIERYNETDLWMEKMIKSVKYLADDGKTYLKAFDPRACQDLLDMDPSPDKQTDDLKNFFMAVSGRSDDDQYQFPRNLRARKRFDILEQHILGDDGRIWVTWMSPNMRGKAIGKMPYPWDLYGKTTYSEFIPLEDMVSAYGDSTIRLMRFLHAMHNRTVAQNFDSVTNSLKKLILVTKGMEMSDEIVVRGNHRQLDVDDINKLKEFQESPIPPGAFEREAQILRMMALLEPALNTVDTGTASNPMAGKLATTAMLNAKAADSLTQFEIDGRDLYLREVGYKKLWMNQQAAQEAWTIEQQFWGEELSKRVGELPPAEEGQDGPEWALSNRFGKTAAVKLDPLDIQTDLSVEPESMSYLSVDDELRKAAAMELDQIALAAPDVVDRRKVIRFHLSTVKDIGNPDDYMNPEQEGPTPPQFKGNISVGIPLDKMPSDVVNQVLPMVGLQPSQELEHRDTLDAVSRMNEAGKAADELTAPEATTTHQAMQAQVAQQAKANAKPNGKAKPKP
jgi:hypothetical protein